MEIGVTLEAREEVDEFCEYLKSCFGRLKKSDSIIVTIDETEQE